MSTALKGIYEIIKKKLSKHSFEVSPLKTINYGVQFGISKDMWESNLRIFEKKTGAIKIDYSALKGEKADAVRSIIEDKEVIAEESIVITYPYIGTDESGKGDTFGPLAVAGAAITKEQEKALVFAGVKDSKANDDVTNQALARIIREVLGDNIHVVTLMPEQYNRMYLKNKNINSMLASIHSEIIQALINKTSSGLAIVDQFADSSLITQNFKTSSFKLHHTTGGEKYTAVAAASILARDAFLEGLRQLSKEYHVEFPKGSGENVAMTIELLRKKKLSGKIHMMGKMHFANLKSGMGF